LFWIEASVKAGFPDTEGNRLEKDIRDIGITTVKQARVSDVYILDGELDEVEVIKIGQELLADRVVEEFSWGKGPLSRIEDEDIHVIEVVYNPGVTDPVAGSVGKAIRDLGIAAATSEKTARIFALMPHPERFIRWTQHPRWTTEPRRNYGDGFRTFLNAVESAKSI
jgi:phosphoribosylformylglycinamidine (FGAM) synthase PurS component